MVGLNMNGPTRDQVLGLIEQKEKLERELAELFQYLETSNIGMHEPLVDSEGFPRADIDVYRVRHARHRIHCLQNDHKDLMKRIETGLHALHSDYITDNNDLNRRMNAEAMEISHSNGHMNGHANGYTNGHARHDDGVATMTRDTGNLQVNDRAFVKVNFVSAGSPAETAGMCVNDEIIQFGSVNRTNFRNLSQIGEIVQHSVGSRVEVKVRRGGEVLNVSLIPNTWAGRGLLGCNIIPV